jgi:hypothetical protein
VRIERLMMFLAQRKKQAIFLPHDYWMRAYRLFCGAPSKILLYTGKQSIMYTAADGTEYCRKTGSRQEVWDGVVYCTSGKLTKGDLIQKNNKIVSKRRSQLGKERFAQRNPFRQPKEKPEETKVTASEEKHDEPLALPRLQRGRKRKRYRRG